MKIFLDSIGCRLNQSEIEKIASQFRGLGHVIVGSPEEADLIVVNTCVVTGEAASDSRQKIRAAARRTSGKIIVTGCWATYDPKGAVSLPNVTMVVNNQAKDQLVAAVLGKERLDFELEPMAREPLPGIHLRTRAFIKVQDGCDNHCTYCVTRLVRGAARSVPQDEVIRDIQHALAGGTKEAVLTGVHLGAWGQDFTPPSHLESLVRKILAETEIQRLRLSSLEPWDIPAYFFDLWENPRLCRHLHLPLQSGAAEILRRMGRRINPQDYSALVQLARNASPDIAITTDVIVGFPGESEDDFAESLDFVRKMHFAGGHVFSYSPRPGTAAADFPGQIPVKEKKQRSKMMREVLQRAAQEYRERFIDQTVSVLWESNEEASDSGWLLHGLTDNYMKVSAYSSTKKWNEFSLVRLVSITDDGLTGKILV